MIDDGYRIVGQTVDGLPKPEFHFVGDDASLVLREQRHAADGRLPGRDDAGAAARDQQQNGMWTAHARSPARPIRGRARTASSRPDALAPTDIVMSTWVVNQPSDDPFNNNWVEVFTRPTQIQ